MIDINFFLTDSHGKMNVSSEPVLGHGAVSKDYTRLYLASVNGSANSATFYADRPYIVQMIDAWEKALRELDAAAAERDAEKTGASDAA